MNALDSRLLALICCVQAQVLATSPAALFAPVAEFALTWQEPKKQDPKPPANDILDAEREKLRMKDVEGWKKIQVKSLDQVLDVQKATAAVELPVSVTDAEKTKLTELMAKAKDSGGGAKTGRALREMEKMGYPALLFLINHLREIDYKDPDSSMFGMQINNSLTAITMGVNTGYVAIEVGEPMDPRKAQWNAQTVQQWLSGVNNEKALWSTREKFDEYIAKRKAKKDAELEGDPKDAGAKPKDEKKKG